MRGSCRSIGEDARREFYSVMLMRRSASELLLKAKGSGWTLPSFQLHGIERPAEAATLSAEEETGVRTVCLFFFRTDSEREHEQGQNGIVLEAIQHNQKANRGFCWLNAQAALGRAALDARERAIAKRGLEKITRYSANWDLAPFARPAWMRDFTDWAQEKIAPEGLRLTGRFRQFNASPTFSLIRLETTGTAVWFKAAGRPNEHELRLTLDLAALFPGYLPKILAIHESWNGWLSLEVPGGTLDSKTDANSWKAATRSLAGLQIASTRNCTRLLASGCKDFRLSALLPRIAPFIERMKELMSNQKSSYPAALTNHELDSLSDTLYASLAELHEFGIPDTLGHMDLNPGNIAFSHTVCRFLDWAEGAITNPLITFEYLRQHARRRKNKALTEAMTSAYLSTWESEMSPSVLRRALALSPLAAVFAYAISASGRASTDAIPESSSAGAYLRALARRMYCEAQAVRQSHKVSEA